MILPLEIIIDILLRLPAKSLLRFKIVCKLWYDLLESPYFVNLHLKKSLATRSNLHFVFRNRTLRLADFDTFDNPIELNYPCKNLENHELRVHVKFTGSCRGLLCFQSYTLFLPQYIYNPTTQTHRHVPVLVLSPPFSLSESRLVYGFGYDSVSDDYKCVVVIWNRDEGGATSSEREVIVYSLKDDIWGTPYVDSHLPLPFDDESLFLNDAIHWVAEDLKDNLIVAFDLRVESFSTIPLPSLDITGVYLTKLGILDGCFCLSINDSSGFQVWVMKEYGVAGSWSKLFCLADGISPHMTAICYSMNFNKILVSLFYDTKVASVDLKTLDVTDVSDATVADFNEWSEPHPCVENLLMLEGRNRMIDEEDKEAWADTARALGLVGIEY